MSGTKSHIVALLVALAAHAPACAALSFTVEPNGWPSAAHRTPAVNSLQAVVNRYSAYGDFGNYNVYAYHNFGIPTAQAGYLSSIVGNVASTSSSGFAGGAVPGPSSVFLMMLSGAGLSGSRYRGSATPV
jgi:hypothetical protein